MSCATLRESGDFQVKMGGSPVPAQYLPAIEIELTTEAALVVQDEVIEVEAGHPAKLVRHYETIRGGGTFGMTIDPEVSESANWNHEPEVSGGDVEFRWNAKDGSYEREVLGSEQQPEELAQLDARLDLAGFLPEETLSVGSAWDVEIAELEKLLHPGGSLEMTVARDLDQSSFKPTSSSGELRATLKNVRSEGGAQVAVIVLEGSYTLEEERATNLDQVPVADGSATEIGTSQIELEGELLWSLDAGRAVSLELQGDLDYELETVKDEGQEGASYSSTMGFSGEVKIAVEIREL